MKASLLLTLCAAALLSMPLFAEGDPRSKIKELEERARTAKEQGQGEEAQNLMEQARRLHAEMAGREEEHGGGEELKMAKRKIGELHEAGKHEEAKQLEQRLREGKEKHGQRKDGAGGADRKTHVMEAIKHLQAAGLHEPAENIAKMVRQQDEKERAQAGKGASAGEGHEQVQRAMREMQEQTQRALRETHGQMAKMQRAIEELREQVAKQRGDGGRRGEGEGERRKD